jgi:hypothetical protein
MTTRTIARLDARIRMSKWAMELQLLDQTLNCDPRERDDDRKRPRHHTT